MNPSDLIQELGGRLGLPGLSLGNGVCRLVVDGQFPVDLEDCGDGILHLHTMIAPMPKEGREAVLAALMTGHLFGLETDGAVFGLHPKTDEIYLFRPVLLEGVSVDGALQLLERFTQQAEAWRVKFGTLCHVAQDASAGDAPAGGFVGIRA